jgi:hypothetical protein
MSNTSDGPVTRIGTALAAREATNQNQPDAPPPVAQPELSVMQQTAADFPVPAALLGGPEFIWDEKAVSAENFQGLGRALSRSGDLYRTSAYGGGLFLGSPVPNVPAGPIRDPRQLASLIADRVRLLVQKDGDTKAKQLPGTVLRTMLASESFLQQFRPIDRVDRESRYLADFTLTQPGFNDGGPGQRILHLGPAPEIEDNTDTIKSFLDVMEFETNADRTNALAGALTVLLRDAWPGAKPVLVVSSTKSHAGKDTILRFASGTAAQVSISYQRTDWALERSFVGALKHSPHAGVVVVENARLDRPGEFIRSAFLERFLTDAEPFLFSTGTGGPTRRRNDLVLGISTNAGRLSEDLLNRALPIHLSPKGDVASRRPAIGNPKLEFLPANQGRIEAELRGLVERWKEAGMPLDEEVQHPFTQCARVVGGILGNAGFRDFLQNYSARRTIDDPRRAGLGLLGAGRPDTWLPAADWAREAAKVGVINALVPPPDRDTDEGLARAIGIVMTAHQGETLVGETEDQTVTMRLEKKRFRLKPQDEPKTRYRFVVIAAIPAPEDPREPDDPRP